jgi:hypothetical protein
MKEENEFERWRGMEQQAQPTIQPKRRQRHREVTYKHHHIHTIHTANSNNHRGIMHRQLVSRTAGWLLFGGGAVGAVSSEGWTPPSMLVMTMKEAQQREI